MSGQEHSEASLASVFERLITTHGPISVAHFMGESNMRYYGARDPLIPAGAMREMLQRLPQETADRRRLALYPEGYHMLTRDLQGETVWRDIDAWLADPDAPLPSGADDRDLKAGARSL